MSDEHADLAARYSAPADRDLPPGRHAMHREVLMSQILNDPPATDHAPRRRPGRRGLFTAVGVVAVGAAAAVIVALLPRGTAHPAGHLPVGSGPAVPAGPSPTTAVTLLDKVALVAAESPAVAVQPDQWFYFKSEAQFAEATRQRTFGSPWKLGPLTVREDWYGQQPDQETMYRANGHDTPVISWATGSVGVELNGKPVTPPPPGFARPTYAWAQSLPTDPARLLKIVYASVPGGEPKQIGAFKAIGQLLQSAILPPATQAAFYKAVELIPGVTFVPDVVDAAGRHGYGAAMTDSSGERYAWIFSKTTYAFLGERDYQARTTVNAKAGTLIGLTAILARGVASSVGGTPTLIP